MLTPRRRLLTLLLLVGVCLLPLGCRKRTFSESDLSKARKALETALDSWKKGESAEQLRAAAEPILFVDDVRNKGVQLLGYQVIDNGYTDNEMMRFRVKLQTQDPRAGGRQEEKEVTYAVALKSPITIGRDPYF